MQVLDGKSLSRQIVEQLALDVQDLLHRQARLPHLAVMLVGEDPASQLYVGKKAETAKKIGLLSTVLRYPVDVSQSAIEAEVDRLNADPAVDGILIQLPLPKSMDTEAVLSRVRPDKDVDGFHPHNLGRLLAGDLPVALPCTPAGMMSLLDHYGIEVSGKHAVVVGRSNIVGKPVGLLLLQRNATVTFCHSRTKDLVAHLRSADIVVAAIGVPEMIKGADLKPGAVVLDVGINRKADGKLCGDVEYTSACARVSAITPVPGGVGPMTIATLMRNTFALYRLHEANAPAPVG